jgi:hypothetical protein
MLPGLAISLRNARALDRNQRSLRNSERLLYTQTGSNPRLCDFKELATALRCSDTFGLHLVDFRASSRSRARARLDRL